MNYFILLIIVLFSSFLLIKKINSKTEKKEIEEEEILIDEDKVFNVENFNNWFNDTTKSKEIYAHPGIFLRTDKLSQYHFEEYFKFCGIKNPRKFLEEEYWKMYINLEKEVIKDWHKKLLER
jgi:hypothetical protein